jgi:hypothetical protein
MSTYYCLAEGCGKRLPSLNDRCASCGAEQCVETLRLGVEGAAKRAEELLRAASIKEREAVLTCHCGSQMHFTEHAGWDETPWLVCSKCGE